LVKTEDHINKIGFSERTDAVIEPKLSLQWFVSMKELAQPALDNVMNGNINFTLRNSKILTVIGWKMSKIGVFLVNCGGDIKFLLGIMVKV
jgi:valyl-tRNA synthetase